MSINQLPNEILPNIFQHMYGSVVIQCRAVCRRWRDVVDGLPDSLWERICMNDYLREDYKTARKKYGLPWRDVYKAINSWRNIRTVSMDWGLISENVQHFKVLPHGIIALLKNEKKMLQQYSDTIVYYDLAASNICGREEFDFVFSPRYYDENDHFIALIKHEGTLVIVLKVNKTQYAVGNLYKYRYTDVQLHKYGLGQEYSKLTIIDNEIYFQDGNNVIYVSRIIHENGVASVHTQPIHHHITESVVAFSKKNGTVYVLTNKENIYILNESGKLIIKQLCWDCCGFDWRLDVFNWLLGMEGRTKKCHLHGNIILVAHKFNLKIFLTGRIMGKEELESILKGRAKRSIDMRRIVNKNEPFISVEQLDIVETPNEHKILVLAQRRLFVFELKHSTERMRLRRMTKRKVSETDSRVAANCINIPKKRKTGCEVCDT